MKSVLKKYLITGLLILVPILVSWIVLLRLVQWLYGVLDFDILPQSVPSQWLDFLPDIAVQPLNILLSAADFFLALLTVIVVLLFTGMIGQAWIMRRLISISEAILNRLPLVGIVYRTSKQLMETVLQDGTTSFQRVVLVEFPREGLWSIGFVSNKSSALFDSKLGGRMINVFVPTTPNPTTGFLMVTAEDKVVNVNMTVEDAFKMLMSMGVVQPMKERPSKHTGLPADLQPCPVTAAGEPPGKE
ncbi:MAG: DUF502 domain-containing protein [Thermodesulfobacteriota bacterium]